MATERANADNEDYDVREKYANRIKPCRKSISEVLAYFQDKYSLQPMSAKELTAVSPAFKNILLSVNGYVDNFDETKIDILGFKICDENKPLCQSQPNRILYFLLDKYTELFYTNDAHLSYEIPYIQGISREIIESPTKQPLLDMYLIAVDYFMRMKSS